MSHKELFTSAFTLKINFVDAISREKNVGKVFLPLLMEADCSTTAKEKYLKAGYKRVLVNLGIFLGIFQGISLENGATSFRLQSTHLTLTGN